MITGAYGFDSKFVSELIAAGLMPPNCTKWCLEANADSIIVLRSEAIVTEEQMATIIGLVLRNREEVTAEAHVYSIEHLDRAPGPVDSSAISATPSL